jgi:hypothetical protein
MGRKNGHIRFDRHGTNGTQRGKGGKRRRDWHHTSQSDVMRDYKPESLPDLGTGADPTAGTPTPLRRGGRRGRTSGGSL